MPRPGRIALLLLACGVAFLHADGAGASQTAPTKPSAVAWYPSGVGTVTAKTYPTGTLHVGAALGQETDRTYLHFELPVPDGADLERVTVAAPLDPAAGTSSPETAVVLACAVPAGFDADAADPAVVDCKDAPRATVTAEGFSVEVGVSRSSVDVALVPGGGDTWHLGFESPTAVATYAAVTPSPPSTTTRPAAVAVAPPFGPAPFALPPVTAAPPSAVGQAVAAAAEEVTATPAVAAQPASTGSGFRYAGVFALPLVLLVVVGVVGDGLTRPVRLRGDAT